MATDRKTIGITPAGARTLDSLVVAGHFPSEMDAAKFAMAHALATNVTPGSVDGAVTKWNVGTFDGDGTLRSVLEALLPNEEEPYRLLEQLINEGLRLLDSADLVPDVAGLILNFSSATPEAAI